MNIKSNKNKSRLPIGSTLKRKRKELGLTLQKLADLSGLSAPFISQIENNKTIPSMVSLAGLATALDVDISYFITIPQDKNIVHRVDNPNRIEMETGMDYFLLSSDLPDRKMDIITMIIPPGFSFPVDHREGEDFLMVLEGELYAEAGNVKTTLKAGDSMHFDSQLPHTARNTTHQNVKLLYVGTPTIFFKRE